VVLIVYQRRRHVLNRKNMIDEATGRGALRHPAFGVMIELSLAEGQAP
jgi:hypothetical protein